MLEVKTDLKSKMASAKFGMSFVSKKAEDGPGFYVIPRHPIAEARLLAKG